METTFFLGACTGQGFVSHYDALFREAETVNIIKGGSGCGKSTFMRSIAAAAKQRGLEVVYILCSSDPDSLDGILLPRLGLAYADGTAPHVLEPDLCGGSRNYLNFGEYYDRPAMRKNEAEILLTQRQNQAQYPTVTACLAAADQLTEIFRRQTAVPCYEEELAAIAECLCLSCLKPVGDQGRQQQRFLQALTPKGLYFCRRTPAALCQKVYVLKDNYFQAPKLLSHIQSRALELGYRCILCYTPQLPKEAPSHLLLPDAGVAFVSESRELSYSEPCFCRIDLDSTLPPALRRELDVFAGLQTTLMTRAVSHLREAKRLHDRMEQLCKPFVDFAAIDRLTRKTVAELFE